MPSGRHARRRRLFHAPCALALVAAGCGGERGAPNVLLITLDTTRADRLGCYGYEGNTTPAIDALAARGARFERVLATAGITPLSHGSILTGLNPYGHGLRAFYSREVTHRLKDEVETLPELLGARGYRTAAFVSAYPASDVYGLGQGFDEFDSGLELGAEDLERSHPLDTIWYDGEKNTTQRRGDYTVDHALEWLDENGRSAPWCAWVHLFDVHDVSLVPPLEFVREHGVQEYDVGVSFTDPEWRIRMYDPELAFMDAQVARLVEWLEDSGQLEHTLIVITADHGQGLAEGLANHGWIQHRLLYDWGIRVPLILCGPGADVAVVGSQVRTTDILPTVLELLGVEPPATHGESLVPLMRGAQGTDRVAYAESLNHLDEHVPRGGFPESCRDDLFCVTDGRWKLIHHDQQPENTELFDLDADPRELRNVAARHPDEVARLRRFLETSGALEFELPAGAARPDAGRLIELGYGGEDEE